MKLTTAVTNGLHAAFLLARGRPDGLRFVSSDMAGAARSFWAMAVAVPAIVGIRLIVWVESGVPADGAVVLARDLLIYGVSWLAFVAMSHQIVTALGRGDRWPHFITAWNWCNVAGTTLVMLGGLPGLLGTDPMVDQVTELVAMGWALWLEWYAIRLTLNAGPLLAVYLVVLDQLIGLSLALVALSVSS